MKTNRELTLMLRNAENCLGAAKVKSLLPKPFALNLCAHDTGCQIDILLKDGDVRGVLAWYGSVWYSHIYEFNDRNKIFGLQHDMEFAASIIEKFFADVENAWIDAKTSALVETEKAAIDDEQERKDAIAHYRGLVSGH